MNIIIAGCGKVGQTIAKSLAAENKHNITVVDIRRDKLESIASEYDVMGVCGSATSLDALQEAGVEDADVLIAVTGSDEYNLLACLIAKKAGNCQTIARVRKPEYEKEIRLFKEDLGLAMVINPEETAAREMARVLRFPTAIQIDTFAKGRVEILKFRVQKGSVIEGMSLARMSREIKGNVLICGVERNGEAFIPSGYFQLEAEDLVSIVGAHKDTVEFFKKIGIKTNKVKDAFIVGGGDTAYYLAKRLIESGIDVKIIEKNAKRCNELCDLLPKAQIIHGDGSDKKILIEEGIDRAEAFVALTNIDEENILLSLFANSRMNGKLITKINRIEYDEVINNLNLDTTIYPKEITAEYIVRFVRAKNNSVGSNIETMHFILDGKAEALEFHISENSPIENIPLETLKIKNNTLIACIHRKGQMIIPGGSDVILEGDTVIVVTTNKGYNDIADILE